MLLFFLFKKERKKINNILSLFFCFFFVFVFVCLWVCQLRLTVRPIRLRAAVTNSTTRIASRNISDATKWKTASTAPTNSIAVSTSQLHQGADDVTGLTPRPFFIPPPSQCQGSVQKCFFINVFALFDVDKPTPRFPTK